jgi:hypothetical protein
MLGKFSSKLCQVSTKNGKDKNSKTCSFFYKKGNKEAKDN